MENVNSKNVAGSAIPVEEFLAGGHLKRSDVLLFNGKRNIVSRLIKWVTRSNFSHAGLVFVTPKADDGFLNTFVIESAASSNGVDITDLRHYVVTLAKEYDVVVKRLEKSWFTDDIAKLVRGHMLNFIKADYDYRTIWQIAKAFVRKIIFGVRIRAKGRQPVLARMYQNNERAPSSFICSGFVQHGFYEAVRRLIDSKTLPESALDDVAFSDAVRNDWKLSARMATTPDDLAQAVELTWKYVIKDGMVYAVHDAQEAHAILLGIIARQGGNIAIGNTPRFSKQDS